MLFRKISEGYVVQVYNDAGECLGQTFHCGDSCEYETGDGDPINVENMPLAGNEYHPYNMEQPDINTANLPEVIEALDLHPTFGN